MKIIIDPYRGGKDTGKIINDKYEKNILLELSKYMKDAFKKKKIMSELIRNNDVSLTDEERNSIINELKNDNDLIIQNRISEDGEFNIIYPLRNSDTLPSIISNNLSKENINVNKFFQRRLPVNTMLDYYNVIRNTKPNETIIIEYIDIDNYEKIIDIIVESIYEYLYQPSSYTVKKGDSLYSIAKKFNTTVIAIKERNNLQSNNLFIGQKLLIPSEKDYSIYTVKKGDSLYSIAKKFNTTIDTIKKINKLTNNMLSIGKILKIPK